MKKIHMDIEGLFVIMCSAERGGVRMGLRDDVYHSPSLIEIYVT